MKGRFKLSNMVSMVLVVLKCEIPPASIIFFKLLYCCCFCCCFCVLFLGLTYFKNLHRAKWMNRHLSFSPPPPLIFFLSALSRPLSPHISCVIVFILSAIKLQTWRKSVVQHAKLNWINNRIIVILKKMGESNEYILSHALVRFQCCTCYTIIFRF